MAGTTYADYLTDLRTLSGEGTTYNSTFKRLILRAVDRISSAWDWPHLWDQAFFTTIAQETTGTVTIANGSQTVTGSSTAFTSAMVGRKIRFSGERAYYTIKSYSSSSLLTLDQPYQGSQTSGVSYVIYQDEYYLQADVDSAKLLRQIQNGLVMFSMNPSVMDKFVPTPQATGSPFFHAPVGRAQKTYTTGTVSMSSGSRTLTGSSTAWTSALGIGRGTKIVIGSAIFTVKSVDSDTQITTYEAATSAVTASSTYTALINNLIMQVYSIPTAAENIYYRFQRIPAIMDADTDLPDMPYLMQPLVLDEAIYYFWVLKGFTEKAVAAKTNFEAQLQKAILHFGLTDHDRHYRRSDVDLPTFRSYHDPLLLA